MKLPEALEDRVVAKFTWGGTGTVVTSTLADDVRELICDALDCEREECGDELDTDERDVTGHADGLRSAAACLRERIGRERRG